MIYNKSLFGNSDLLRTRSPKQKSTILKKASLMKNCDQSETSTPFVFLKEVPLTSSVQFLTHVQNSSETLLHSQY